MDLIAQSSHHSKLVRTASSRVVAAIAGIELPAGTWGALLPWLEQSCTSADVSTREVGIFMLYAVLETLAEYQSHLPALFALFEKLVQDPQSLEVRATTVRFVGLEFFLS